MSELTREQIEAWRTIWKHSYGESGIDVIRDLLPQLNALCDMALKALERGVWTDEQIMAIVCRETDTLDCTRVSEMVEGSRWKTTTIFDGDAALLRCIRAVLAAAPVSYDEKPR
jgi:hypothetical protein